MRVLIVEDNAFNAFCLRRLLESVTTSLEVTIVNNSQAALLYVANNIPDLVIVDGDLGALNAELHCNGPQLSRLILKKYPHLPLIAWSDSDVMRQDFAVVFEQFDRPYNEYNSWTKVISLERICKTWAYYFGEFMGGQNAAYTNYQSSLSYR